MQKSLNALQYYTETQNGVLITEVPAIQRFVIERSHCIHTVYCTICSHTTHPDVTVYLSLSVAVHHIRPSGKDIRRSRGREEDQRPHPE